ncbi:MAG: hypothetical protein H0X33_11645 [Taibaiella sp.]|nr:hypothetical protein [Taibaiella sp.]
MKNKFFLSVLMVFVVLAGILYWLCHSIPSYSFTVLIAGNGIMAALTIISFMMVYRQMSNRPQAFVRGVSGASFFKLIMCMVAILVYLLLNRQHIYKPSIFILFGIYAVYTTVETIQLSRLAKRTSGS